MMVAPHGRFFDGDGVVKGPGRREVRVAEDQAGIMSDLMNAKRHATCLAFSTVNMMACGDKEPPSPVRSI